MGFDYAHAYEHELEQRDRLRSAATTPIWVLTLLGTVAAYAVLQFQYGNDIWTWLFAVPLAIGLVSLGMSVYFLIRALHGHTYKALEKPSVIRKYQKALLDWHTQYGSGADGAEEEFEDYIEEVCAEAADVNATLNQIRSEYYFRCYRMIISALVFIALAVIPFVVQEIATQGNPCGA